MTLINVVLKHFLYTIGINILFDKLIENFPSSKYDFINIDFDDIQVGDTILAVDKYDDNPSCVYGGTVSEINGDNRSILFKKPLKCSVFDNKWTEITSDLVPVFSDRYYGFVKRVKRH